MGIGKIQKDSEAYVIMRKVFDDNSDLRSHFHFHSKVWKEIRKYIEHYANSPQDCVLIQCSFDNIPSKCYIPIHRGTGHSISLNEFGVYHKNYLENGRVEEADWFWMKIAVGIICEEISEEQEIRKYRLNVPTSLMMNFDQEVFDDWIDTLIKKRNVERDEENLKQLQTLIARYPEQAKELLEHET